MLRPKKFNFLALFEKKRKKEKKNTRKKERKSKMKAKLKKFFAGILAMALIVTSIPLSATPVFLVK